MSAFTSPIPIVMVGIHSEIGGPIAEGLRPDWDTVRQIQSYEAALSDLPHLLRGQTPPTAPTNAVGSGNYAKPVRAVLFGRGFSQNQAESLYEKFGAEAAEPVLWAAGGNNDASGRPEGAEPPAGVEKVMLPILKKVLEAWKEEGGKEGKLVLY